MRTFPERLQYVAGLRNFEQADLARALGKSPSEVNRWWQGEVYPGPKNRKLLSKTLDYDLKWLECGKGKTPVWGNVFRENTGNVIGGSARDVHYLGPGQHNISLPPGFLYLAELLDQLPNTDEYTQKLIATVIAELHKKKDKNDSQ